MTPNEIAFLMRCVGLIDEDKWNNEEESEQRWPTLDVGDVHPESTPEDVRSGMSPQDAWAEAKANADPDKWTFLGPVYQAYVNGETPESALDAMEAELSD